MTDLPLGIASNDPGNLRPLPNGQLWNGQTGTRTTDDGTYCMFADPEHGIRACLRNIMAYTAGPRPLVPVPTPRAIFAVYAPSQDANDPASYAAFVAGQLGVTVDTHIDLTEATTAIGLVKAIAVMENGWQDPVSHTGYWYSDDVFEAGVMLALPVA